MCVYLYIEENQMCTASHVLSVHERANKDILYEHAYTHTAVPFLLVMDRKEIKLVSKQGYSRPTMQNIVLNQLESDVFI